MPVPEGPPEVFCPEEAQVYQGHPEDPKTQKKSKDTKDTKQTKPRPKRHTKKEQDEAAVMKFLSSPLLEDYVSARISVAIDKINKSDKADIFQKGRKGDAGVCITV